MTYSSGRERKPWPSEGGVVGNAFTPARAAMRGCISRARARVLRSRCSQSTVRNTTLPCDTVGLPMLA